MKKICMLVFNPCTNDARVLKEATTLAQNYEVHIIATISPQTPQLEKHKHYTIHRIEAKPFFDFIIEVLPKTYRLQIKDFLKNFVVEKTSRRKIQKAKQPAKKKWQESFRHFFISSKKLKTKEVWALNLLENLFENVPGMIFIFYPFFLLICIISKIFKYLFVLLFYVLRKLKPTLYRILMFIHTSCSYFFYWLKAKKIALKLKAHIYHAHDFNTLLPAYLAAKRGKGKMVYDSHEFYTEHNTLHRRSALMKSITKKIEQFFIVKVDVVITVNQSIAKELSQLYKVLLPEVVMNCPDYRQIKKNNLLREILSLPRDINIVLYLGQITFNRGIEQTIIAMKEVKQSIFVVMGYGNENFIAFLKQFAAEHNILDKLYFVPPVSHDQVTEYAASADIGVIPIQNACKSYYYCSPNKLFESMMAGLPVVASDFPELRRIVQETDCGLLFPCSDPGAMAKAINYLIDNKQVREKMSVSALHYARKYSWKQEQKKLLKIYQELECKISKT